MKERLEHNLILLAILSFSFFANAQETRGLSVGDTCPDVYLKKIINSPAGQARLSSWKGKMVLLDFMTSRCLSCIKALPKIDSLRQLFKDQVFVAAVTNEQSPAIERLLGMTYLKNCTVPFIVEDTILHKLFPHISIPHIVWLDENQVVKAITYGEYLTTENIQSALDKPKLDWMVKKEVDEFDSSTSLFTWNQNTPVKPAKHYFSAFSTHLPGISQSRSIVLDTADQTITYSFKNFTIINLFRQVLKIMNKPDEVGKTFLIEARDSDRFTYSIQQGYRDKWYSQNTFCYETKFPTSVSESNRGRAMINDLNRFLNLSASFEYRLINVWHVVRNDTSMIKTKGGFYTTRKLLDFIHQLNVAKDFPLVVTNLKEQLIHLSQNPSMIKTREDLNSELNKSGLKIVTAMREVEVFVIK